MGGRKGVGVKGVSREREDVMLILYYIRKRKRTMQQRKSLK